MMITSAYFIGEMVQTHTEVSPGEIRMDAYQPGDSNYGDMAALAEAMSGEPEGITPATITLDQARARAILLIDARRGQERRRYMKDVFGQETVYSEKRAEAVAMLADPAVITPDTPDSYFEAEYPILTGEARGNAAAAAILGPEATAALGLVTDPHALAQVYLNLAFLWRQVCGVVEECVAVAQAAVDAATTPPQALQIPGDFAAHLVSELATRGYPT